MTWWRGGLLDVDPDRGATRPYLSERTLLLRGDRESRIDEGRLAADTLDPGVEVVSAAAAARLVVDLRLSRRLRFVLRGLLRGESGKDIAAALGVSEPTVSRARAELARRLTAHQEANR